MATDGTVTAGGARHGSGSSAASAKASAKARAKANAPLKAAADAVLFDALVEIGFYRNIWKFDPKQVRVLLRGLTILFFALSVWSWSHLGGYKWMFSSFDLVLGTLYWYWYTQTECGGGRFIFSPQWRDSFVRTHATATHYVVKINVGYIVDIQAAIPFAAFEYDAAGAPDVAWLADELEQRFPMSDISK